MKYFTWNEEKNRVLKKERGISFEEIIFAIEEGKVLDVVWHPNKKKYGDQRIMFVDVHDYVIAVPFIEEKDHVFLKTAFPDRRATKRYLRENKK